MKKWDILPFLIKKNKNEYILVNKFIELKSFIFSLSFNKMKDIYKIDINSIKNIEIINLIK